MARLRLATGCRRCSRPPHAPAMSGVGAPLPWPDPRIARSRAVRRGEQTLGTSFALPETVAEYIRSERFYPRVKSAIAERVISSSAPEIAGLQLALRCRGRPKAGECPGANGRDVGSQHARATAVRTETPGAVPQSRHDHLSIMLANIMQGVDNTIANVALPHIQGSLSASQDQVAWVLTSYIVSAAVMMPLTGWLAGRFGIKYVFLTSVAGFTVASALCGCRDRPRRARRLPHPPRDLRRRPRAVVAGDIIADQPAAPSRPCDGGVRHRRDAGADPRPDPRRLADRGLQLALVLLHQPSGRAFCRVGVRIFMRQARNIHREAFDAFGFASLSLGIGAFQLMLDRGELKDWFHSTEIWTEATVAGALLLSVYGPHGDHRRALLSQPGPDQEPEFRHRHDPDVLRRHHSDRHHGAIAVDDAGADELPGARPPD